MSMRKSSEGTDLDRCIEVLCGGVPVGGFTLASLPVEKSVRSRGVCSLELTRLDGLLWFVHCSEQRKFKIEQ